MYSLAQKGIVSLIGDEMKIELEKEYETLFHTLINILLQNPSGIQIGELKKRILASHSVNEEVINEIIEYMLSKKSLKIIEPMKKLEKAKIGLVEIPEVELIGASIIDEYPKIVVSLPPYNIFGLERELKLLNFPINTMKEEFQKLFERANHSIYICSPFLEYNGFDIYLPILLSKAKTGVDIKIVSRQIGVADPNSRYKQINKIQRIFKENMASISIRNYHFFQEKMISSSIHAKMIISDYEYAYIGSGELRKNSFDKNFEVGVILKGEQAHQLGKIFEKIFSVSASVREEYDGTMV